MKKFDAFFLVNTLRVGQNGRHFKSIVCISIKISLNFVPRGSIYNIPACVQIMAWHLPGDRPLSEPMMVSFMMTSSNGNIFRVTGPLCGEFTGPPPHKGQWRGALMFSLICVSIKGWVNKREAGDLRRHHDHYDVSVMLLMHISSASVS